MDFVFLFSNWKVDDGMNTVATVRAGYAQREPWTLHRYRDV